MRHRQGFPRLRCPKCGEAEGVAVLVENLALHCTQCAEDITRAEVNAMLAQWTALLTWIDAAPTPGLRTPPVEPPAPPPCRPDQSPCRSDRPRQC